MAYRRLPTVGLHRRIVRGERLGLAREDAATLARLVTPQRIQDYVSAIPTNFEATGDTCLSVAEVLRQGHAHCIEGAFVAACALWINGYPPLLMDFQAEGDDDHVVALFKTDGCWGAISKSNHVWLRWRDPIYRSLRELALSYFHEYVIGPRKTLRRYSRPFDLRHHDPRQWVSNGKDCWQVAEALDLSPHYPLLTNAQARRLKKRDPMELAAGKLLQTPAPDAATAKRY